MSHSNKEPPSFFIVPSEKRDYSLSLQLGNVIYSVQQPHLVLFRLSEASPSLAVTDTLSTKTLRNYVLGNGNSQNNKTGLFAKILEFFGAGGEISHQSNKDLIENYTIQSITFKFLEPSAAFREGLKRQDVIIDHLQDGSPAHAFLVTGIVTATGVVFESTSTAHRANEASLGINVQTAPLGFMARRSKNRKLRVDWEDPGPTILAFQVQKLRFRDRDLIMSDETDGAYFGDDVEEDYNQEVEYTNELDQNDLNGLEKAEGEDEMLSRGFKVYFPDE